MRIIAIFLTLMIHVSNIFIRSYGHISNTSFFVGALYNSIARICVPIFFMISGALLINGEYSRGKYLKRIKKFIIILAFWSIIYFVINVIRGGSNNIVKVIFYTLFNTEYTSKHLWFMYAIIGLYIALPFIQKMCKNLTREEENLFMILWVSICGLSIIYTPVIKAITGHTLEVLYPIPLINAAYYLGYFVCGHIIYERIKNIKLEKKYNFWCIMTYILSVLIMATLTYFLSVSNNKLTTTMLWYRGILIILESFSMFILILINEKKFKSKHIETLGGLSFGVYLIHAIFLFLIKDNINITDYNPLWAIPVITIVIYATSVISSYILKKIPIIKSLI